MNTIIKKKKKKNAFTLIELIIVLAIMAIIAAIAIPNFTAVRDNSKIKADTQSRETIKRTVLMLVSDETIALPAVSATKSATLAFTGKSISGLTGSTFTGPAADATAATLESAALLSALKDVKAPQVTSGTFIITVSPNGDVTVAGVGSVTP